MKSDLPVQPSPSWPADPRTKVSSRICRGKRRDPAMVASLSLSGGCRAEQGSLLLGLGRTKSSGSRSPSPQPSSSRPRSLRPSPSYVGPRSPYPQFLPYSDPGGQASRPPFPLGLRNLGSHPSSSASLDPQFLFS